MRKFGILSVLLFACCLQLQAKVYLVSVGIADYPGKENDLRISDNDAKTIAKVFKATKDASVNVLTNEDATQSALLSTMHTAFEDAQSDDAVILYFSGHGTPGSLVCHDGLLTSHAMQARCVPPNSRPTVTTARMSCYSSLLAQMKHRWKQNTRTACLPSFWNEDCEVGPM